MNIKNTILILLSAIIINLSSCSNEGIDNPSVNKGNETASSYLPGIIKSIPDIMYNMLIGGDMGMLWSQQVAKVQYIEINPRQGVIQHLWDDLYNTSLMDAEGMYQASEIENNDNLKAIALLLKVYSFALLTDTFGDIPFSEAFTTTTPSYDLQEEIYPELFNMLDNAIELFNSNDLIDAESDILYGGDVTKWKKFANSLKFRCLIRVSGVMSVESQLQSLIDDYNMFNSNDDEAKLFYSGSLSDANQIYKTIVGFSRFEWKTNSYLLHYLNGGEDPRTPKMIGTNVDGLYVGTHNWPDWNDDHVYDASPLGDFYLNPTAPGYLLSYSELEFLIAEAAQKGLISGVSAEEHYNLAVTASFEANEVGLTATNFLLENPFIEANALEQIGVQKWLALYCQGNESWTEYRRTNFPVIPSLDSYGSLFQIPTRLTYPANQATENTVNYSAAIASQGEDILTTPLWWQQ